MRTIKRIVFALCLPFLILVAAPAPAHQAVTLDFDTLTPGMTFTSAEQDGFIVSAPSAAPVQVHPGAPACAPPASCRDNGTPSLVATAGGVIRVERADGGPFKIRQVQTASVVPIGCTYTAWLDGDPTPIAGSIGCSVLPFTPGSFSPSLDGARIVALEITKASTHFQIDNIIVEPSGPPPDVTLLEDGRTVWAAGTLAIYDEYWEFLDCTSAIIRENAPSPPFVDYRATVRESDGEAFQDSSVSPARFAATGSARGDSFYCWGFGTSTYEIEFRVHSEAVAHLQGSLHDGTGSATATLTGPGGAVFSFQGSENPSLFHDEATLPPGDYRLSVVADTNGWIGGWAAEYEVELDLVAVASVPLIGSIAQFALPVVLAGMGAIRLRRR